MASSVRPARNKPRSGSRPVEVKHRACDECRSRKLACSKEQDGCDRCRREGIACNYSAQKPMGRPRKRAIVINASEAPAVSAAADGDRAIPEAAPRGPVEDGAPMDLDQDSLIDPNLISITDMNFLDLLGLDFTSGQSFDEEGRPPEAASVERPIWDFDVSYDAHNPPPAGGSTCFPSSITTPTPSSQELSPAEPSLVDPIDPALSCTCGTTATTTTTTTAQPPPSEEPRLQPAACSCLAGLYLALDSVSRLPTEVLPAMRVARGAAKAAHDTIMCQVCSPPLHETLEAPLSSFQNMMVLGALVPSIADAYHRILAMVDAETARAIAAQTEFRFSLSQHGGLWGNFRSSGAEDSYACAVALYENQPMSPAVWRLTVRALLKADLYGVECKKSSPGGVDFRQIGLRDLVSQMDEKSIQRHAYVDRLVEAGLPAPTVLCGKSAPHIVLKNGEAPPCRRIIAIAREAVEGLVIA